MSQKYFLCGPRGSKYNKPINDLTRHLSVFCEFIQRFSPKAGQPLRVPVKQKIVLPSDVRRFFKRMFVACNHVGYKSFRITETLHLQKTGLSCPIPSMICRFIVLSLARPLFHLYMRHRLSATRFSHPYGFKLQRAANPSSSLLNISSRKSSVPCHVQVICTKYMDSVIG
jgi:hypothetical protein